VVPYTIMSQLEEPRSLDFSGLISAQSIYLFAFSWLLGQNIYQTFIGGLIAHRSLTRQAFSVLQAKTFPIYFSVSASLSGLLFALWSTYNFADIKGHYISFGRSSVLQAWTLALVFVLSCLNLFWIGPVTNEIIMARQRLEREEGKPYYVAGISSSMRRMNKRFSKWHGFSSLANLVVILALAYHGFWYGNYGLYNRPYGAILPKDEFAQGL